MPPTVSLPPLPGLPVARRTAASPVAMGEARPDGPTAATGLPAPAATNIAGVAIATAGTAASPQDGAVALYARLLEATSLEDGARRLVAALVAGQGCDRASIGVHEAGRTRLLASFPVDLQRQPQDEAAQRVLGAMDEALDQAQSLAWPPAAAHADAVSGAIGPRRDPGRAGAAAAPCRRRGRQPCRWASAARPARWSASSATATTRRSTPPSCCGWNGC